MRRLHLLTIALMLPSASCRTVRPRADVPAVIVDPTPGSRAALAQAVGAALGGARVTLAEDALTRTSTLLVERARPRDPSGLPANGRQLGAPERFHLVQDGAECVLVHERSGERFALAGTTCSPE